MKDGQVRDRKVRDRNGKGRWSELIGPNLKLLFAIECLLLVIGIVGAIWGKTGILYSWNSMEQAEAEAIKLGRGTYRVELQYEYAGDSFNPGSVEILVVDGGYRSVFANGIPIYAGTTGNSLEFTVAARDAVVRIAAEREEKLVFTAVELVKTKGAYFKEICAVLCLSLLLNLLVLAKGYQDKFGLSDRTKAVWIAIPFVTLLASFPSLTDYHIMGADMIFHLMRVEALKHAILNGELHVRMQSLWLAGHGYANSFFYGDTLIFVPAVLRVLGFTADFAFRLFIVMLNLLTACIAYYSFGKMFGDYRIGIFGCVLYTLAPYRIYNCYNRSAMGEFAAMTFLPLLIYGFYRIYTADSKERSYRWSFLIPVIGFSGVIQSHMLSCEMAGIFTVILCLMLWKKTFTKEIFIQLCGVVVATALINAWYIVPCLDLMAADAYYFGHNANVFIQDRGVYLWQFFYTLQAAGSSSKYPETGFMDAEPIGMGIAMLAGVFVLLFLLWKHRWDAQEKTVKYAGIVVLMLLGLALFMSTSLFPWDFLSAHGLNKLVGPIQFPTRFTSIVSILAVAVCCFGVYVLDRQTVLVGIAGLSVLFAIYQTNDIAQVSGGLIKIYDGNGLGTTAILGAEYLPEGANVSHMTWHAPKTSEGVDYMDYVKDGLQAEITVRSAAPTGKEGYIDFPMLYYKGYAAYRKDSGEKLTVGPGENYDVRVVMPADFQGAIHVGYVGMWYWRVAEIVSILTGILLISLYFRSCSKNPVID
ncbi:MAG: hypothetical protein IJ794_03405 [Lachnospiraceae bacterium]|nr:hypothetical protein [Lachnospiraceae bacterium]